MGSDGVTGVGRVRPVKVFISYARGDVKEAEQLESSLADPRHNLDIWRDKNRLRPGDDVNFVIADELVAADVVITLWSETSAKSDWVRHETASAVVHRKAAMIALTGFDYGTLPSPYRHFNCGDLDKLLTDPSPLLEKIAEIVAAKQPAPPKLLDIRQLPRASNRFIAREAELAMLRSAWTEQQPHVLALIAAGGTGKTALAGAFLDEMAAAGWPDAEAV